MIKKVAGMINGWLLFEEMRVVRGTFEYMSIRTSQVVDIYIDHVGRTVLETTNSLYYLGDEFK
mgnify:FL=1